MHSDALTLRIAKAVFHRSTGFFHRVEDPPNSPAGLGTNRPRAFWFLRTGKAVVFTLG